jgi:DNA-binding transcriptional LysR family regulator
MDKYQEMRVFATVVDAGSFVKAADALALSKQAVSRYVSELEARLGVSLLRRTTRRLSLTDEGRLFYLRCTELLERIDEAEAEITSRSGEASGQLSVNVPLSFGLLHLAPLWPQFMSRHPKVMLDVTLSDRVVDLVDEGVDLAVRVARLPSSSLIARQITSTRVVLCASPQYLQRRGAPTHPAGLAQHDVLSYSLLSTGEAWQFTAPDGRPVSVEVSPRMRTNSGDTCRAAALQHQGIILQPSFIVGSDLASGRLVEVLPGYRCFELGVYAVYPSRKFVSPKVRLLIDFLVESFRVKPWPH